MGIGGSSNSSSLVQIMCLQIRKIPLKKRVHNSDFSKFPQNFNRSAQNVLKTLPIERYQFFASKLCPTLFSNSKKKYFWGISKNFRGKSKIFKIWKKFKKSRSTIIINRIAKNVSFFFYFNEDKTHKKIIY